ncbi:glycosyltransferase family 2 protein [Larkinella sp. C7]|uniref:glycosyltransferase family 2 protein n=1 Tax=Larkinella sp. C7 TaxID=2576607 RepID=UPI001110FC21|nr:glycosyltransferase family 2 protein [Larkinella sp. C7]
MIFICIPVFNRLEYTIKCIDSIIRQKKSPTYEIIICDDGSTDGTYNYISHNYENVKLLKGSGNLWWAGGTNECVKYALGKAKPGDYVFTLNNDTELFEDTLEKITSFAKLNPKALIGCVSLFHSDLNSIEVTAFQARKKFPFSKYHKPIYEWGKSISTIDKEFDLADSLSGKGVLIPIEVFNNIGIYNFEKLPHYHSDTEFIRRAISAGYKAYIYYGARVKSHQDLSGVGQINNAPDINKFIKSFFILRSSNHLTTQYNRAKLIYSKKWPAYFLFNNLYIIYQFSIRYISFLFRKHSKA